MFLFSSVEQIGIVHLFLPGTNIQTQRETHSKTKNIQKRNQKDKRNEKQERKRRRPKDDLGVLFYIFSCCIIGGKDGKKVRRGKTPDITTQHSRKGIDGHIEKGIETPLLSFSSFFFFSMDGYERMIAVSLFLSLAINI